MNKSVGLGLLVAIAIVLPFGASQAASFRFSEKDVEEITGEVQKPDVTIVISRENLNKAYELDLERSFVDRIIESVDHAPF